MTAASRTVSVPATVVRLLNVPSGDATFPNMVIIRNVSGDLVYLGGPEVSAANGLTVQVDEGVSYTPVAGHDLFAISAGTSAVNLFAADGPLGTPGAADNSSEQPAVDYSAIPDA